VNGLIKIGKLTKLHGIKGSVALQLQGPHQPDLKKAKNFFIEINGIPTPFFVTEVKVSGKNLVLAFDTVTSMEAAQKILNCAVWLDEKQLKKQEKTTDLTGFLLNDKVKGKVGVINKVIDMPGQKMFSLSVDQKEVLLPFTEDLIVKIDQKLKTVFYNAPEGLIDIYMD
jgi:16S rRNA processing protein RimM